jgi:hypothetical protein
MTRKRTRQLFVPQLESDLTKATIIYMGQEMPSNLDADMYLQDHNILKPSWILGTGVVYEKPRYKLKDRITSDGLIFMVPQKYQGLSDVLLVFQKGFKIDKGTGLFTGEVTQVLENFPTSEGWYATDPETGLPQGRNLPVNDPHARRLWRRMDITSSGSYIGAVARGSEFSFEEGRGIDLSANHNLNLYIAQFSPTIAEPVLSSLGPELQLIVKGYTLEDLKVLLRNVRDSLQGLPVPKPSINEIELIQELIRASEEGE